MCPRCKESENLHVDSTDRPTIQLRRYQILETLSLDGAYKPVENAVLVKRQRIARFLGSKLKYLPPHSTRI